MISAHLVLRAWLVCLLLVGKEGSSLQEYGPVGQCGGSGAGRDIVWAAAREQRVQGRTPMAGLLCPSRLQWPCEAVPGQRP